MTKNRFSNRSGFSPVQRQIGQWPRVPSNLLSDDVIDPGLMNGAVVDDMERMLEMRRIAQKAFIEHNAKEALNRVEQGRSRAPQGCQAGDYVYVYRVSRAKKRKHEGSLPSSERTPNKATWVGPGTLIAVDGASLWVSMFGELWRVAREQCRKATNVEKQGIEEAMRSCQELVEDFKRSSNRKGYKDLRGERRPEDDEGEEEEEDRKKRPREEEVEEEQGDIRRQRIEEEEEEVNEDYTPTEPGEEAARSRSRRGEGEASSIEEEPEVEDAARDQEVRTSSERTSNEEARARAEREAEVSEAFRRSMIESAQRARSLDGIPSGGGPVRWRSHQGQTNPYFHEVYIQTEETDDEEEAERRREAAKKVASRPTKDFWELDEENLLIRIHHIQKRRAMFNPEGTQDFPVPLERLQKRKTTIKKVGEEEEVVKEEERWRLSAKAGRAVEGFWWKGVTEFKLHSKKEEKNQEKIEVWAVANASGGGNLSQEVDLSKEDEKDLEEWKVEDKSEFDKIQRSKAIEVLSPEESRKIREELRKEGKEDRILPSRMARRYKPAEQPGVPPSKKSRLCIRGDKDPDILELDRFSPTVNTMNLNVMLQIAINAGMTISIGDLKSAFCQSDPLERANGPLYFRQPSEGISGLHPEQICKIVAGCYGLVDAPLHWRKTLLKALGKLGFKESRLDPCIYKLYEEGRLMGLLAIEVDDILACGKGKFHEKMKQLRSQFTFGKCVNLKEEKEGASFNGRRLRQDEEGTLHIDMQKFIEERLEEIPIDKERKKEKKEEVNERERTQARAVCGSLNWLSKEGRPDAAGPSSLMSSRLTTMKVEDLCCLNEVIKQLKNSSNLCLKVQPLTKMRLAVITDASFGNDGFHSQGRQMIVAHEEGLQEGRKVKANLLWWRSAKLQRVVNSTLAAETQSLSKGMGDLLWMKVLFKELEEEKFNMYDWPSSLAKEEVVAMATCENGELQRCLAIVDAKSLFDYLSKQTIGGQDKRTAIEIQIIRQELAALNGEIRWIDHPAMVADCLTKVKGSTDPLFSFLRSGCFCIAAEEEHLKKRKEDRSLGISNAQIRAGVNKSLWSCKNGMSSMSTP